MRYPFLLSSGTCKLLYPLGSLTQRFFGIHTLPENGKSNESWVLQEE
jgi:hypothetical protein